MAEELTQGDKGEESLEREKEIKGWYRSIGVLEDTPYDEIQAEYRKLVEKYKGDKKKQIKLEVIMEKILNYRLKQRVAGQINVF